MGDELLISPGEIVSRKLGVKILISDMGIFSLFIGLGMGWKIMKGIHDL